MVAHVGWGALEVHHQGGARMKGRQGAHLQRVEHAEDVELPFLGEVRRVGEKRKGDVHHGT